jgi:hypothetical protein
MKRLMALVVLAGCAAGAPQRVAQAPLPVPSPAVAVPVQPPPPAVTDYQKLERLEVPAVNGAIRDSTATPEAIDRIHKADIRARAAVRAIVRQDGHPTVAAKLELKRAMDELLRATEMRP